MTPEYLRRRAELLALTRTFFRERGFQEVETPLASQDVIPEAHIVPVRLEDGRYLQASPELAMKRLLCAGSGPIFQIAKAFRADEHGRLHRGEFTLVEWYRPGDDLRTGMALLGDFVQAVVDAPPCTRTSYRDAFWNVCRVDPHNASGSVLAKVCEEMDIGPADDLAKLSRDELLNLLLAKRIEPRLGREAPELLYHYPATQSALAATTIDAISVEVAERFELYWRGVELANGYHELTDAEELRRRLEEANERRIADGRAALPLPEELLGDMASPGLPPCAGVALGFDRLVMLAVGAKSIDAVMTHE